MRTKLYKMWLKFSKTYGYMSMNLDVNVGLVKNTPCIKGGYVSFNYKLDNIYVNYPSPEYDAWRAFMLSSEHVDFVVKFIFKNWTLFKQYLPATSIWLELNQKNDKDILKLIPQYARGKDYVNYKSLTHALCADLDGRKIK